MGRTLVAAAVVTLAAGSACGRVGYATIDDEVPSGAYDATGPADVGEVDGANDDRRADDAPGDASFRDDAPREGDASPDGSASNTDAPAVRDAPSDADASAQSDGPTPGLCSGGICKRAFVSSTTTNGGFGGLAMGDQFCQSLADARGLGGVFKAWLSDDTANAEIRFSHPAVPYRLVDGTLIANDWADLIDGNLAHAIDMYETGVRADVAMSHVWTSTTRTGRTSSNDCNGWLSASAQAVGGVGLLNSASTTWTAVTVDPCDRGDVHLYCFEQ